MSADHATIIHDLSRLRIYLLFRYPSESTTQSDLSWDYKARLSCESQNDLFSVKIRSGTSESTTQSDLKNKWPFESTTQPDIFSKWRE